MSRERLIVSYARHLILCTLNAQKSGVAFLSLVSCDRIKQAVNHPIKQCQLYYDMLLTNIIAGRIYMLNASRVL